MDTAEAMSREAVETLRRMFEAWSRGNIDAFLADACLDIEAVPLGAGFQGKVCRGQDEVRAWWEAQSEVWETFLVCAEEFEQVDKTLVVVSGHWQAVGRGGVEVSAPATWVIRLRDGKLAYWQAYTSRAAALEAVGLSG